MAIKKLPNGRWEASYRDPAGRERVKHHRTRTEADRWLTTTKEQRFEFPVLVALATLGMFVMVSAQDLISLYVGVELQSLAAYVLAAWRRDDARSSEAGLKYFVLSAISSGLLLFGSSFVYGFTGSIRTPPANARTAACCTGAQTDVYVSLATTLIASRSQSSDSGNVNVPSRQPPAPHHLESPELMMVPSG